MNREIKFRAWDYQGETMLYSDKREHERYEETDYIFQITHNGLELITLQMTDKCEDGEHIQRTEYLPTECDLMQWTGLKDKNGVEIYQGDVVRCWGGASAFGYHEYEANILIDEFYQLRVCDIEHYDEFYVLGNIHQHPELLEVKC